MAVLSEKTALKTRLFEVPHEIFEKCVKQAEKKTKKVSRLWDIYRVEPPHHLKGKVLVICELLFTSCISISLIFFFSTYCVKPASSWFQSGKCSPIVVDGPKFF